MFPGVEVWCFGGDGELVIGGEVDLDGLAFLELASEDMGGEGNGDIALDGAGQGAGAIGGVEAEGSELLAGGVGDLEGEPLGCEESLGFPEFYIEDLAHIGFGEVVEDDDVVEAVEEFWLGPFFEGFHDVAFHGLIFGDLG